MIELRINHEEEYRIVIEDDKTAFDFNGFIRLVKPVDTTGDDGLPFRLRSMEVHVEFVVTEIVKERPVPATPAQLAQRPRPREAIDWANTLVNWLEENGHIEAADALTEEFLE